MLVALYALYIIINSNGPHRFQSSVLIILALLSSILWIVASLIVGLNLPTGCVSAASDCGMAHVSGVIGFLAGIAYGVLFLVTACRVVGE